MKIEFLYFDGCPSYPKVEELLCVRLAEQRHDKRSLVGGGRLNGGLCPKLPLKTERLRLPFKLKGKLKRID